MMLCVWLLLLIVLPLVGCQEGKRTAVMLADAEVLMYSSSDSALQILESIPHPERLRGKVQADYALLLTQAHSRNRITATSDSLIRIAVNYYRHSDDNARKAASFLYWGDVYMDMQNYVEAMKVLKQAEEVVADAETRVQSLIYGNLGYLNKKTGNYQLAGTYYQKALAIDKSAGHIEWIVGDLTNILTLPLPEVQENLTDYIAQLEDILLSARPDLQAKAYNNIGVHYYSRNQTRQAAEYFQKAIRTSVSVPYRAYLNLARIYDSEGNTARADSLCQVALQSPIWATRARIYEALYERNLQSGRYQEAVTYMKLYQQAIDSFYTHRQAKEIQELQTKYDYEVLFREKVETENRLLRLAIGTGCLLLFGIVVVYHFKRQHTRQLQELENLIRQINDLEDKDKGLEELVNTLNESLERHKVLSNEFLRVKGKWTASEDILALGVYIRLKRDISLYDSASDLSLLGHWLDIVSAQFASRLCDTHPHLTATGLSVCYFYRLGYSIHDTAQAMHVKPETIKRYIYRACIDLGISQSREEFAKYISKF